MDVNEILKSMEQHIVEYPYIFYKEAIHLLKKMRDTKIFEINEDPHILEAIRLNVNYNKYRIHFINKPIGCCRKLKLSEYQIYNLFYQLFAIEKDNFMELCKSEEKNKIINNIINKLDKNNDRYIMFVCFSKNSLDSMYSTDNYYDVGGVVFGIDSFRMLQHQRLDRLCNFITSDKKDIKKVITMMLEYRRVLRTLPWIERERILIFSGTTWQLLGTTYTADVDLIVVANNKGIEYQQKLLKLFNYNYIDSHILLNDNKWHKRDKILDYQKEWFTYTLPNISGARDIYEMVCNPKHYCFYMGLKLMSIESLLQRSRIKALPSTLSDLIMIKKINNLEVNPKPCIPNMIINQGRIKVYYGTNMDKLYMYIQNLLKLWYQKDMSINDIKKEVSKCSTTSTEIYSGRVPKDLDTENIKLFHTMIKKHMIEKYCHNCDSLLDIGSGRLRDADFWDNSNIVQVVAVEPSISSVNKAFGRLKKRNYKTRVDIIHGHGDDNWINNDKYNIINKYKYCCITFMFTIHYMIKNLNVVLDNLLNVSKIGTKVIILCMNGNYIREKLQGSGQIEIRNKQEPIFAIYDLSKYNNTHKILKEVLVYFKGTYGVQNGSIEYIFDYNDMIKSFTDKGFNLIEKFSLLDIKIPERNKLNNLQKEVSKFFMGLIFEKI